MLLTYQEETKQPLCPIAGLPTPLVLSSAGKLILYLHGSCFLPYRKPSFVPQMFLLFCFFIRHLYLSVTYSARLMSVMCTERSLLPIMSRHAPYCWLATSFLLVLGFPTQFSKAFLKNTYPTFKIFILTRKIKQSGSRTFTLEQKSGFKLERNKDFTFIVIIIHMDMKKNLFCPAIKYSVAFCSQCCTDIQNKVPWEIFAGVKKTKNKCDN